MKTVVRFESISKRYKIGLARTSLPTTISRWLNSPAMYKAHSSQDEVLWSLKDVSFILEQGQSLALIGPNGAGKTTILKLLANITKPTSGQLSVSGKLSALIELGAGFHPDLTGRENIFLNGMILGMRRNAIKQRFDEIVEFSELERFIDTPVKRYSSGMTVRLGFAVASCIEPDILLVDEVLAVGDAAFQQKCLKRILSLVNNGTSIIFVSHNLYLVQAACTTALYLQKGQMKHYGDVKDVLDLYEKDIHRERARKFQKSYSEQEDINDDLLITHIDVWGADKVNAEVLESVQPAQIQIHYHAQKPIGKLHLQVFIFRSDGVISCMMRTKLDGYHLSINEGQGSVLLRLTPLQLVGGAYYVEASFMDETDSLRISSAVARSDWFTVRGVARSYAETSVFEPHTTWAHYQNGKLAANSITETILRNT